LTQNYDLIWGKQAKGLSIVVGGSFVEERRIKANNRDISRFPVPGTTECSPSCSSGTPQGRFVFTDPGTGNSVDITPNTGTAGIPVYDPADPGGVGDDFHGFETTDRFNYAPFNLLQTPSRRMGFFSLVRYELLKNLNFQGKAVFNNRRSTNQAAPEPIFIGPESGNGNRLDTISVDASNPYNPFGFSLDAATNPYFIGRRPLEAGPRVFSQNVNTFYVAGGLDGDFSIGSPHFYWDATVAYAVNRADQIKEGGFNSAKLAMALGPVAACNADPHCGPFNIFGGQGANGEGTITQEMLDYVSFIQKDVSEQRLVDFTLNVSGDLLHLPAGTLSMAAGYEGRRQSGFFRPDSVVTAGDSAGVPASPTSGSFDVHEGYVELLIPILSETPGVEQLDVSGAIRVSDYSTFGAQETFHVGARWRPVRDLLVRGGFAQGFRTPGIGELFGTAARFDQTLSDPCSDMRGSAGGQAAPQSVIDSCTQLGVPNDGSYQQFNPQTSVSTGGNRDLKPETSNGVTASLVYRPEWAESVSWSDYLSAELTYYRISVDGAIQALDAQVQLDACVRTQDPALCSGITRTATGVINGFSNQLTNIGKLSTDGVDVTLRYAAPNSAAGHFRVTSLSNVLISFTEKIPSSAGFETINREGTEVGDPERAFPRFKSTLILDWLLGDWQASWTARYVHSVTERCRDLADYPGLCSDPDLTDDSQSMNKIDPVVYNDVRVSWTPSQLSRNFQMTLGVNNIFNQDPPRCFSCSLNGFDATTYNVPGVFGYLQAGYKM
jgi:iron complex outermembrane receptor protein